MATQHEKDKAVPASFSAMVLESDSFQITIPGKHLVSKLLSKNESAQTAVNAFTEQDQLPTEDKKVHSTRYNAGERYNLLIMCPYCSRRYAYKETMKHHIHSVHSNPDGSIKEPISAFTKNPDALKNHATVTEEATVEPTVSVKQEPMDESDTVEVIETPVSEATVQEIRTASRRMPAAAKMQKKQRTPDWRAMPVTGINNKTDHRSKFKIYNKKTMKLVGKDGKLIDFVYMSNASKLNGQKVFYANRAGRRIPQEDNEASETAEVMEFAEDEKPLIKSEYIDPDEPCTVTAYTDSEGEDVDEELPPSQCSLHQQVARIKVQQTPIFTRGPKNISPNIAGKTKLPVLAPKPTVENQYWKTIAVEKVKPPPTLQKKPQQKNSALKTEVSNQKTIHLKPATVQSVKIGRISGFKIAKPLTIKKTPTC